MAFKDGSKRLFIASIILASVLTPMQGAIAANDPLDTQYEGAMTAAYADALFVQLTAYNALTADSAAAAKPTTSKYKAWKSKMLKVINQIKASSKQFAEIPASPGYVSSRTLAVAANTERQKWIPVALAYLQKSNKVTSKDRIKMDTATNKANDTLVAWSNQYQKDMDFANLAIPATAPAVSFNTHTNTDTGLKSMQATIQNTSMFEQSRMFITEYVVEWYYKDLTTSPIVSAAKVEDLAKAVMFQLDGVTTGDMIYFKVAAKNAMGQGPWSSIFSTPVL
jgi:hypothetical protein